MATDRVRPEFLHHHLNELGAQRSAEVGAGFSKLLDLVESYVPASRDRALTATALQVAYGHAMRGIDSQPEHQVAAELAEPAS